MGKITTGMQARGRTTEQLSFAFFHVSKRAADSVALRGIDVRIEELAFLWRVGGDVSGDFEGDPVENVKFGKGRSWLSVDWLISRSEWRGRSMHDLVDLLGERLDATPDVLEPIFTKRKVAMNRAEFEACLTDYARRMRELAHGFLPNTRWVGPQRWLEED